MIVSNGYCKVEVFRQLRTYLLAQLMIRLFARDPLLKLARSFVGR